MRIRDLQHLEIAKTRSGMRPLVLVVEHDPDTSRQVCQALAPEFRTARACDPLAALEGARAFVPDAIVADGGRPGFPGDELLRRLRSHPVLRHVPVVVLGARTDDADRLAMLRAGARDYVFEPFAPEELRVRVANLISLRRARDVLEGAVGHDLPDVAALAADLVAHKREVEIELDTARVAQAEAELASQYKSEFLGLVSHELRTPLTALKLQVDVLSRDPRCELSSRQSALARRMSASVRRLTDLVESLLQYSRIQRGQLALSLSAVDLRAEAEAIVEGLRPQAEQADLELRIQAEDPLPPLVTDPDLVRLILANLVQNGIKHTEAGWIAVELASPNGEHRLCVRDTGPGIPAEYHSRVFETRAHPRNSGLVQVPGSGLGLALVREMVHALGGRIELASAPGAGSTFSVFLPQMKAS